MEENLKSYSYYAHTSSGYTIKTLIEVLQNCLGTEAHIDIEKSGISICQQNKDSTMLVVVNLPMSNFIGPYICKRDVSMCVDVKQLSSILKNVKKRDSLTLSLSPDRPGKLLITVIPKSTNSRGLTMVEKTPLGFKEVTKKKTIIPKGYNFPIVIPSSSYQKVCKKISINSGAKSNTEITVQNNTFVSFICSGNGITPVEIEVGTLDKNLPEDTVYRGSFHNNMLISTIKLSGLSDKIQICGPKDHVYPLKFKMKVGNLGMIEIFIKTSHQIQYEANLQEQRSKKKLPVKKKETEEENKKESEY